VETIKESYEMSIFSGKKSKINFFRISPKMFWEGVKEHCGGETRLIFWEKLLSWNKWLLAALYMSDLALFSVHTTEYYC